MPSIGRPRRGGRFRTSCSWTCECPSWTASTPARSSASASGFLLKDVRSRELIDAVHAVAEGDAVLTPRITRAVLEVNVPKVVSGSERERLRRAFRQLTDHEREICSLIADGLSNGEIAERLVIQPASAKRAVSRILSKLGMRDRTQIAVSWYRAGL